MTLHNPKEHVAVSTKCALHSETAGMLVAYDVVRYMWASKFNLAVITRQASFSEMLLSV